MFRLLKNDPRILKPGIERSSTCIVFPLEFYRLTSNQPNTPGHTFWPCQNSKKPNRLPLKTILWELLFTKKAPTRTKATEH